MGEAARAHVPGRSSTRPALHHATEFDRNSSGRSTAADTRARRRAAQERQTRLTESSRCFSLWPTRRHSNRRLFERSLCGKRLHLGLQEHATDRTIGRNAGNPSPSAPEAVFASSSRAAMSGSRARHQQWSRAFLMDRGYGLARFSAARRSSNSGILGSAAPTVVGSRHPPESGIDEAEPLLSNAHMRLVHPITSQRNRTPRYQAARRMPAPSRLPSVYPTQASAWRRLLRALGLDR